MSPHRSRSSAPSIVLEADLDDGLLCGRRDVEYHKRSFSGMRSHPAPRVMFSSLCPHAGQRHPRWFPCSWLEAFPINEKLQSDLPARQADCDGAVDGFRMPKTTTQRFLDEAEYGIVSGSRESVGGRFVDAHLYVARSSGGQRLHDPEESWSNMPYWLAGVCMQGVKLRALRMTLFSCATEWFLRALSASPRRSWHRGRLPSIRCPWRRRCSPGCHIV